MRLHARDTPSIHARDTPSIHARDTPSIKSRVENTCLIFISIFVTVE